MKEWILPTVGTFICWGLWSFIPKITTKYIDPRSAIVYEVIGGIVLSLIVLSFTNFRLETHPKGIALAGMAGLHYSTAVGIVSYFNSIHKPPRLGVMRI